MQDRTVERVCTRCSKKFFATAHDVTRGGALFCTRECNYAARGEAATGRSGRSNCACSWCQTALWRRPSQLAASKSGFTFCGKVCRAAAQKAGTGFEALLPSHYHTANGRPRSERSRVSGQQAAQRKAKLAAVACECCGYNDCLPILQVHHRDGDHKNNKPANLAVWCPTCHSRHHYETRTGPWSSVKLSTSGT